MTTNRKTMTTTIGATSHGPPRPHPLATALLTAAVWLTAAAAANAQAVATATPNQVGKASRLQWAINGTLAPINGQIPTSLTMSAPPGFTFNPAAAAKRCKPLQAQLDECPQKSRIGSAVMTIHIEKPSGPRDLPIDIKLYLGPKNALLAVAFLAGVRVVPGSISGSNGITVTFNPLPVPPPIPQVSYSFIGVTLHLGASRTIRQTVKPRKKGRKKVRKGRRVRIDLVTNPPDCGSGAWALSSTLGLPDGTAPLFASPVACAGSSSTSSTAAGRR
jgi:hypothetical protein